MTLQELRDELDQMRPAWEELTDLDDVLKDEDGANCAGDRDP